MNENPHTMPNLLYMEARNHVSDWYRSITGYAMATDELTMLTQRFLRGECLILIR